MTKTRADVINAAFRRIGVRAEDEELTADQEKYGGEVLDSIFAELQGAQGLTITWTLDTTPDALFVPMANYLAVEVAPAYEVPARESRARALHRIREALLEDDREDFRDLDEDGTISDAEVAAGLRSEYY